MWPDDVTRASQSHNVDIIDWNTDNSLAQENHIYSNFLLNLISGLIEISFQPVRINVVWELFSFNASCTKCAGINIALKTLRWKLKIF